MGGGSYWVTFYKISMLLVGSIRGPTPASRASFTMQNSFCNPSVLSAITEHNLLLACYRNTLPHRPPHDEYQSRYDFLCALFAHLRIAEIKARRVLCASTCALKWAHSNTVKTVAGPCVWIIMDTKGLSALACKREIALHFISVWK